MASISGWGRVGYGDGPWGLPGPVAVTGIAATGGVGSVVIELGIPVTGIAATGSVGSVGTVIGVELTGIAATASVGNIDWWFIDDGQTPSWSGIDDSQDPGSWPSVDDSQTPGWTEIAA
mgnify:CR=1 FL=1